ncbi:hypothetical protein [Paenibacillus agricola]|uniref:Methyl-accepting chemotaxis protein n=1 Tax=Paenibacillus agricola TaxID=2716264 RepID=A0ABX0JLI6_9BACL|nr:hypothetical protein [Paenibacillus agricola]NHN35589.1 hypothetical protein [Paenibacillus agricola]
MKLSNLNLAARINLFLGIVLLFGFFILTSVILKIAYDSSLKKGEDYARLTAKNYGNEISSKFNIPKENLDQLKREIMLLSEQQVISREQTNQMLIDYLSNNKDVLDVYMTWEPEAFDGKDK